MPRVVGTQFVRGRAGVLFLRPYTTMFPKKMAAPTPQVL